MFLKKSNVNSKLLDHIYQLLFSKMNHDLSSSAGTVYNSIEILHDESSADFHEQSLQLSLDGTSKFINKLQFYRLAYGTVEGCEALSDDEFINLVEKYINYASVADVFINKSVVGIAADTKKAILNVIITCIGLCSNKSTISIEVLQSRFVISCANTSCKTGKLFNDLQYKKIEDINVFNIQKVYTKYYIDSMHGYSLNEVVSDDEVVATLKWQ